MPHSADILKVSNTDLFGHVEDCLRAHLRVKLIARGDSMLPFIVGDRDAVILCPVQTDSLRVGDIVLARLSTGIYVLHRIVALKGEMVILMGDGNLKSTECCSSDAVLGVVELIVRKGHEVDVRSKCEERKVRLWMKLLPLRRYFLFVIRRIVK